MAEPSAALTKGKSWSAGLSDSFPAPSATPRMRTKLKELEEGRKQISREIQSVEAEIRDLSDNSERLKQLDAQRLERLVEIDGIQGEAGNAQEQEEEHEVAQSELYRTQERLDQKRGELGILLDRHKALTEQIEGQENLIHAATVSERAQQQQQLDESKQQSAAMQQEMRSLSEDLGRLGRLVGLTDSTAEQQKQNFARAQQQQQQQQQRQRTFYSVTSLRSRNLARNYQNGGSGSSSISPSPSPSGVVRSNSENLGAQSQSGGLARSLTTPLPPLHGDSSGGGGSLESGNNYSSSSTGSSKGMKEPAEFKERQGGGNRKRQKNSTFEAERERFREQQRLSKLGASSFDSSSSSTTTNTKEKKRPLDSAVGGVPSRAAAAGATRKGEGIGSSRSSSTGTTTPPPPPPHPLRNAVGESLPAWSSPALDTAPPSRQILSPSSSSFVFGSGTMADQGQPQQQQQQPRELVPPSSAVEKGGGEEEEEESTLSSGSLRSVGEGGGGGGGHSGRLSSSGSSSGSPEVSSAFAGGPGGGGRAVEAIRAEEEISLGKPASDAGFTSAMEPDLNAEGGGENSPLSSSSSSSKKVSSSVGGGVDDGSAPVLDASAVEPEGDEDEGEEDVVEVEKKVDDSGAISAGEVSEDSSLALAPDAGPRAENGPLEGKLEVSSSVGDVTDDGEVRGGAQLEGEEGQQESSEAEVIDVPEVVLPSEGSSSGGGSAVRDGTDEILGSDISVPGGIAAEEVPPPLVGGDSDDIKKAAASVDRDGIGESHLLDENIVNIGVAEEEEEENELHDDASVTDLNEVGEIDIPEVVADVGGAKVSDEDRVVQETPRATAAAAAAGEDGEGYAEAVADSPLDEDKFVSSEGDSTPVFENCLARQNGLAEGEVVVTEIGQEDGEEQSQAEVTNIPSREDSDPRDWKSVAENQIVQLSSQLSLLQKQVEEEVELHEKAKNGLDARPPLADKKQLYNQVSLFADEVRGLRQNIDEIQHILHREGGDLSEVEHWARDLQSKCADQSAHLEHLGKQVTTLSKDLKDHLEFRDDIDGKLEERAHDVQKAESHLADLSKALAHTFSSIEREEAEIVSHHKDLLFEQLKEAEKLRNIAEVKVGTLNKQIEQLQLVCDLAQNIQLVSKYQNKALKHGLQTFFQFLLLLLGAVTLYSRFAHPLRGSVVPT